VPKQALIHQRLQDVDTPVARELAAQRLMVTGEHLRVLVAPLLQQARGALDVGEQDVTVPCGSGTSKRLRPTMAARRSACSSRLPRRSPRYRDGISETGTARAVQLLVHRADQQLASSP
jgi:hypothetical protein